MPNQKDKRFSKGKSFHPYPPSVQASASAGTSASAECGGSLHGELIALHDHSYAAVWLIPQDNKWSLDQLNRRFQDYEDIKIEASIGKNKHFINFIFKSESKELLNIEVCVNKTTKCVVFKNKFSNWP
eukprot:GHVP01045243.1.p1 GENE.GHVP01045243.1~~GHVP01045243.1.p1  ORF type:complete len:128 (-),score=20.65 GHVP01045243.1:30-413(-)